MTRRHKPRRGIVILVVLSLLVLFVLMAVTFVIVAGQYRRAAEAMSREKLFGVDPQKQLDSAVYQLLRDNPLSVTGSVLRFHSLLWDMYGADGFSGSVLSTPQPAFAAGTGNQFLDIAFAPANVAAIGGGTFTLSSTSGYYAGCVFTITSGPARGTSTRIVGYTPASTSQPYATFRVVAMKKPSGQSVTLLPPPNNDLVNSSFVVNGRPFNGTGVGYPTGGATPTFWLGASDSDQTWASYSMTPAPPSALMPNYPGRNPVSNLLGANPVTSGDVDESYDAADYQNMFLGLVLPNAAGPADIVPSFHRRELVNYWAANAPAQVQTNAALRASFLSRVVLRPLPWPNLPAPINGSINRYFTGSNPDPRWANDPTNTNALADLLAVLENGPWDVDNDGDGIADSVWLDLGFPIQTAPDGRRYKPLFAILCTDLDGRLNVNAHDRMASLLPATSPAPVTIGDPAAATTTQLLPRGQGYGPPEISLAGVFGTALTNLQNQRYAGNLAGATATDLMSGIRFFDHPGNYFSGAGAVFRSPPDLHGELRMGLSMLGQPQWEQSLLGVNNIPYQLNLALEAPTGDTPFTAGELERVLRHRDLDVTQLPSRLAQLVNAASLNADQAARLLTTHSFDLPSPNVLNMRAPQTRVGHVIDLLRQRLSDGGYTPPTGVTPDAGISQEIDKMLSPDLILGLRMDINRILGDELDNNSNGAVNDPAEAPNETVWSSIGLTKPEYQNIGLNHVNGADVNGDGTFDNTDRMLARQLYARHLYVLAMTLFAPDNSPDPAYAKQIAQWAVNVVDFRDPDAIMTPFEYDSNPFNGWGWPDPTAPNGWKQLDGDPTTDEGNTRGLVWGCERPELLITETLAWHDRRTEDLNNDDGDNDYVGPAGKGKGKGKGGGGPNPNGDDDYDQRLRPRSAVFFELYNPWAGTDTATTPPRELYGATNGTDQGVLLSKVTPGNYPVWRLLVMDMRYPADPDLHNDPDSNTINAARGIYFVNPGTLLAGTQHGQRKYFPDMSADPNLAVASIKPGQYAVVGPAGTRHNGEYCSFVGRNKAANETAGNLYYDWTRRVALIPSANPNVNQVKVYQGGDVNQAAPAPEVPAAPAVGIVINGSDTGTAPLSISEPVTGYQVANWDPALAAGEGAYNPPMDPPADFKDPSPYAVDTHVNGTTFGFAIVHLQRLADPTRDYHATGNPYRTIDSASIALTAFNGLEDFGEPPQSSEPLVTDSKAHFETHQRGDSETPPPQNRRKLWRHDPDPATGTNPTNNSTRENNPPYHYFDFVLTHTFGSINRNYLGAGGSAFPWLTWNDRPFVSQYELMQVPATNSYELLRRYDFDATSAASPYGTASTPPVAQFPHLANFFDAFSDHPYRLLEYTHVPSRFNGSETIFNPTNFASAAGADHFRPPFNRLSHFRDPGRVNINTIMDARVWNAIVNGFPAPTFDELVASRRGYTTTPNNALLLVAPATSSMPSLFANPFRAPGSGALVPLTGLVRNDIETTLLRSDKVDAGGDPNANPRFQSDPNTITEIYRDVRRNPYFRYQNLQRLGNLVTTRSNVYATWITMGYFEVDDTGLGQEVGLDTGEVKRHRAFYMIDRSIPVAFEPGENHNVDRCILVRRYIE